MRGRSWLRDLASGMLDLVFAPICVACRSPIRTDDTERIICRTCWSRSRPLPVPRCARCSEPVALGASVEAGCRACELLPPRIRVVRSAFVLAEPVREMVHALKYQGWEAAAVPMAARLAELPLPPDVLEEAQLAVPVPVTAARLRERGYNQAALLAAAFAELTGRTCEPRMLVRSRAAGTQTALHPDERRANVAGAFAAAPGATSTLRGEHVLLIDDVWTTGATALACSAALFGAGARVVSVLTFARAVPNLDAGHAGGTT